MGHLGAFRAANICLSGSQIEIILSGVRPNETSTLIRETRTQLQRPSEKWTKDTTFLLSISLTFASDAIPLKISPSSISLGSVVRFRLVYSWKRLEVLSSRLLSDSNLLFSCLNLTRDHHVISEIAWNKWSEHKSLFLTKNASILRVSQSKVHKVLNETSSGDTRH